MSSVTLNEAQLVALVETYFAAVDRKDIAGTLACLIGTTTTATHQEGGCCCGE